MKVHIDRERCQGHGMCVIGSPKVFAIDDGEGLAMTIVEEVPADQEAAVKRAVGSCPERAISVSDAGGAPEAGPLIPGNPA